MGRMTPSILVLLYLFVWSRWIKQSEKLAAEAEQPDLTPKLDLSFKEGQTIHINLGVSIVFSGWRTFILKTNHNGHTGWISALGLDGANWVKSSQVVTKETLKGKRPEYTSKNHGNQPVKKSAQCQAAIIDYNINTYYCKSLC